MSSFKPTEEQLICISTAVNNKRTVIEAVAGAGKSSTLVLISKELIEPSIYLAFNKVTATEAQQKFPKHVECRTTHSVAYAEFGHDLNHKLSRPRGKYVNVAGTGGEIAKVYRISEIDCGEYGIISAAYLGVIVKDTVAKFEQSAYDKVCWECLPYGELKDIEDKYKVSATTLGKALLTISKKLWNDRINICSTVLATHDTYIKLWQLSKPVLRYNTIYLDEAQDTTPCVLDVVNNQTEARIVAVGDSRQNIYSWRGSVNGMELITGGVRCLLSQSFRYGQAIADIAKIVLANAITITGREDILSIAGLNMVDTTKPYTVLCRTNAYLLDAAVTDLNRGKSVSIEIDVRDFVKVLESSVALFEGRMKDVKHERVVPYDDFAKMKDEGGEFSRIANIIENYRAAKMIELLSTYTVPDNPEIVYTTCHKSKGREFSQVVLASDFPSHYGKKGVWVGLTTDEQNLLYVAVTRAIDVLEYNNTAVEAVERYGKGQKQEN